MHRVHFDVGHSETIGLGHLARCAALAGVVRSAGGVSTVAGDLDMIPGGFADAFVAIEVAPSRPACTVVDRPAATDGDRIAGVRVQIDDGPGRPLDVDIVVDPNLASTEQGYQVRPGGAVLAGGDYALVGSEVVAARRRRAAPRGAATKLLLTCGASDPHHATEFLLDALRPMSDEVELLVLVGPMNPRRSAISDLARQAGATTMHGLSMVDAIADIDLAVTTLGVTATELACIGVPNLAIAHSDVQEPHLRSYHDRGLVHAIGRLGAVSTAQVRVDVRELADSLDRRLRLYETSRRAVDGQGAHRVWAEIHRRLDG